MDVGFYDHPSLSRSSCVCCCFGGCIGGKKIGKYDIEYERLRFGGGFQNIQLRIHSEICLGNGGCA